MDILVLGMYVCFGNVILMAIHTHYLSLPAGALLFVGNFILMFWTDKMLYFSVQKRTTRQSLGIPTQINLGACWIVENTQKWQVVKRITTWPWLTRMEVAYDFYTADVNVDSFCQKTKEG